MVQIKIPGKGPIAIAVILEMPGDRVLFQLRDNKKEIHYPGCWSIFTGGLEESDFNGDLMDSLKIGVARELSEELGVLTENGEVPLVLDSDINLFDEMLFLDPSMDYDDYQYVFHAKINIPLDNLILKEGQKLGVFGKEDLDQLNIAPSYEGAIRNFFSKKEAKELIEVSSDSALEAPLQHIEVSA